MNGIITIDDGNGTVIEDGVITTNGIEVNGDLNANNINVNQEITADIFSLSFPDSSSKFQIDEIRYISKIYDETDDRYYINMNGYLYVDGDLKVTGDLKFPTESTGLNWNNYARIYYNGADLQIETDALMNIQAPSGLHISSSATMNDGDINFVSNSTGLNWNDNARIYYSLYDTKLQIEGTEYIDISTPAGVFVNSAAGMYVDTNVLTPKLTLNSTSTDMYLTSLNGNFVQFYNNTSASAGFGFYNNSTEICTINSQGINVNTNVLTPKLTLNSTSTNMYLTSSNGNFVQFYNNTSASAGFGFYNNSTEICRINSQGIRLPQTSGGYALKWGNDSTISSNIYDNGSLHIDTDDHLYISAPTSVTITTTTLYSTGTTYITNNSANAGTFILTNNTDGTKYLQMFNYQPNGHNYMDTNNAPLHIRYGVTDRIIVTSTGVDLYGTITGVSKTMVGLGNVDNTSDADKPVSTATATQLGTKASSASPSLTGTPTCSTPAINSVTSQITNCDWVSNQIFINIGRTFGVKFSGELRTTAPDTYYWQWNTNVGFIYYIDGSIVSRQTGFLTTIPVGTEAAGQKSFFIGFPYAQPNAYYYPPTDLDLFQVVGSGATADNLANTGTNAIMLRVTGRSTSYNSSGTAYVSGTRYCGFWCKIITLASNPNSTTLSHTSYGYLNIQVSY